MPQPPTTTPQPPIGALVRWRSYERALSAMRGLLGLSGDRVRIRALPGGGHNITLPESVTVHPFQVIPGTDAAYVHRGFVIYAGQLFALGEESFNVGPGDWLLAITLRITPRGTAGAAPSDPWAINLEAATPSIVKRTPTNGHLTPAVIADIDPGADEDISTTASSIYIPIAFRKGGQFVQVLTLNPTVRVLPNGDTRLVGGWTGA